ADAGADHPTLPAARAGVHARGAGLRAAVAQGRGVQLGLHVAGRLRADVAAGARGWRGVPARLPVTALEPPRGECRGGWPGLIGAGSPSARPSTVAVIALAFGAGAAPSRLLCLRVRLRRALR